MEPEERLAKHLEFIQNAIGRMAGNSFLLKGWSVTLVAGLFALAAGGGKWVYAALGLLPSLSFWGLDAYYLRQERLFRKLYDAVRRGTLDAERFSMNTAPHAGEVPGWASTAFSKSILPLHAVVVLTVIVVTIILLSYSPKRA